MARKTVEYAVSRSPEMGMGVHNDFPLLRRCKPAIGTDNFNDGTLTAGATAA